MDDLHLIVRLRGEGDSPREMERFDIELHKGIEAGGATRFDREVTTPCTANYANISLAAYANRRGGELLPTPSLADEVEAAKVEEAASSAGGMSPLGNVGVFGLASFPPARP